MGARALLATLAAAVLAFGAAAWWAVRSGPQAPAPQAKRAEDLERDRRLAVVAEAIGRRPLPDARTLQESRLPLRLVETIVHREARSSTATLVDDRDGTRQVVSPYGPVRGFEHVRVVGIEPRRVVIQHEGTLEQIRIDSASPPAAGPD